MEEIDSITVSRSVYEQFQTLIEQRNWTSDQLMNHFFDLYQTFSHTRNEPASHDTTYQLTEDFSKGDNLRRLTVKIPKSVLRKDISLNVVVHNREECSGSEGEDSSEEGTPVREEVHTGESSIPLSNYTERERIYTCKVCRFKTKGKKKFESHLKRHEERLICLICKLEFTEEKKLTQHIINEHGQDLKLNSYDIGNIIEGEGHVSNSYTEPFNDSRNCQDKNHHFNEGQMDYDSSNKGDNLKFKRQFENNPSQGCKRGSKKAKHSVFGSTNRKNLLFDESKAVRSKILSQSSKRYLCQVCNQKFQWKSQFLHHRKTCWKNITKQNQMKNRELNDVTLNNQKNFHIVHETDERLQIDDNQKGQSYWQTLHHVHLGNITKSSTDLNDTEETSTDSVVPLQNDKNNSLGINQSHDGHKHDVIVGNIMIKDTGYDRGNPYQNQNHENLGKKLHYDQNQENASSNDYNKFTAKRIERSVSVDEFAENNNQKPELTNQMDNGFVNDNCNTMNRHVNSKTSEQNGDLDNYTMDKEINDIAMQIKEEMVDDEFDADSPSGFSADKISHSKPSGWAREQGRSFQGFDNGITHHGNINPHAEGEDNLKCEECGELFKRKAYLKEHIEGKHSGDPRYTCDCGKKFKWRSSLGSHKKHCYNAMMVSLHYEGQSLAKNPSLASYPQIRDPVKQLSSAEKGWVDDIERLKQSVLFAKKDLNTNQNLEGDPESQSEYRSEGQELLGDHQNFTSRERSVSESAIDDKSLVIDSAQSKPFAEALSKYSHKKSMLNTESSPMEEEEGPTGDKIREMETEQNYGRGLSVIDLTRESMAVFPRNEAIKTEDSHTDMKSNLMNIHEVEQSNLHIHQSGHEICNFCNEVFVSKNELERHKLYCKHLQDTCSICGKIFGLRKDLVNHLLTAHGSDESYTCFCNKTFSNWNMFENHCEKCNEFHKRSASMNSLDKIIKSNLETASKQNEMRNNELKDQYSEIQPHTLPGRESQLSNCNFGPIMYLNKSKQGSASELDSAPTQSALNEKQREPKQSKNLLKTPQYPKKGGANISMQNTETKSKRSCSVESHKGALNSTDEQTSDPKPSRNVLNAPHFTNIISTLDQTKSSQNTLPTFSSFVSQSAQLLANSALLGGSTINSTSVQIPGTSQSSNQRTSKPNNRANNSDAYVCTFCGNVYNDLLKFEEHNITHLRAKISSEYNLTPRKKPMQLSSMEGFQASTSKYICPHCGDVFAAKAYLKEHVEGKHGAVDRYSCQCGMKFRWRSSLGTHQKKCPKSDKRTNNRWNSS